LNSQSEQVEYGVHSVVGQLTKNLQSYTEAQYHIRNESLIREREKLLQTEGVIAQKPLVEVTPTYQSGPAYAELELPSSVRETLGTLTDLDVGIYERPYLHQSQALEAFFHDQRDLIIATGTGSGKTESFLMAIIGQLCLEASERPHLASKVGCRALLLYPMNALVNDQISRIRRLFGHLESSAVISRGRDRPVRFGSYTSKTPYPGPRTPLRDMQRIEPLFEDYYLKLLEDATKVAELEKIGQWPCKDLEAFYDRNLVVERNGRKSRKWEKRLQTQPSDRELMTRHEIHSACPDLLVTNYSMLEYMLMRPMERDIFTSTREWLQQDSRNELILVLDEAHMYRGAGGAEVALLLRRLAQRLEIPRERMRCILTSASLGEGTEAEEKTRQFAMDLTGLSAGSEREFALIKGTLEERGRARAANIAEMDAFANFDIERFQTFSEDQREARTAVDSLARCLNWPVLGQESDLGNYLYERLKDFGPVHQLIQITTGSASSLDEIEKKLFNGISEKGKRATGSLLALATFARRYDGRTLIPTRLHLFFRGLPGLFACCNPKCANRRNQGDSDGITGRLYFRPRYTCDCIERSRVFELLTHRECGTAFLRAYADAPEHELPDFLWHESGARLWERDQGKLEEVDLLIDGPPQREHVSNCDEVWIDVLSGHLTPQKPSNDNGFLKAWIPASSGDFRETSGRFKFQNCPVCGKKAYNNGQSSIMNHAVKGEAPFASLIKAQLLTQPATRKASRTFPNAGRKSLIFSDGRQKAARLARDIPREVEKDMFRQLLSKAVHRLHSIGREATLKRQLYVAFLTVLRDLNLALFDGEDRKAIEKHLARLRKDYRDDDLEDILDDEFEPGDVPATFQEMLLSELCGRYYSLAGSTVGFLRPTKRALQRLLKQVEGQSISFSDKDIDGLATIWIMGLADDYAIDHEIKAPVRAKASGFHRDPWGSKGRFSRSLQSCLPFILQSDESAVRELEAALLDVFAETNDQGAWFLQRDKVKICIDLAHQWFQCSECASLMPHQISGRCSSCGALNPIPLDPQSSEYIRARKGYWRGPVQDALNDTGRVQGVSVEEHTAQLSNRDIEDVRATTELHELRFRDVLVNDERDRPIDVLSCTTTMEVGIDIGSLVAVGLRNVPPQRENYQQRAGRAGRRGSSVSTVVAYAQDGTHDNYYFNNTAEIVSGAPRTPEIKIDNPKIAARHINSFLLQTFFHEHMDKHGILPGKKTASLFKALGKTADFLVDSEPDELNLKEFEAWCNSGLPNSNGHLVNRINEWLPESTRTEGPRPSWIAQKVKELLVKLRASAQEFEFTEDHVGDGPSEGELLKFLFSKNLLPSYAFPTNLTSFVIEERKKDNADRFKVTVRERPQQGLEKALSEYAPGRLVVINKETYRSGGVTAAVSPTTWDRGVPLFEKARKVVHCENCNHVQDIQDENIDASICPVCASELVTNSMITPEVFLPENARALHEGDRDQEITYTTMAQFPVPVGEDDLPPFEGTGEHIEYTLALERHLIRMNKGASDGDHSSGFWVCEKCGYATPQDPPQGAHTRPYKIEFGKSGYAANQCNGEFQRVFLGHVFYTDLLLVRLKVLPPLLTNTHDQVALRIIEDALYSIAEGLRIAASRHPQLDLDPAEFGSGFRIVRDPDGDSVALDIYLFDTLSGGAGYAELAASHLEEVLRDLLQLLEECPSKCDKSCPDCLRHFHNQYLQHRLDRRLGAALLRYSLTGDISIELDVKAQALSLKQLKRLLELDGYDCEGPTRIQGAEVPLVVRDKNSGHRLCLGVRPGLIDPEHANHSLDRLKDKADASVEVLNEYRVSRDLPGVHQLLRRKK